ncbi:MAG: GNAT family N-acetyltransferase, partial [Anaerolineales bacterium]|nr:GNAT family N-acetyltransferase [Anaerolineales bacterium]
MTPILYRTKRLSLMGIERRHLEHLLQLWIDPDVMRNVGFPKGLHPDDIDLEAHLWCGGVSEPKDRQPGIHMAVELQDGTFVGEAKLGEPDLNGVAEPDVKFMPQHWGCGFGSEIVQLLIAESFRRYPKCVVVQFTPNVENRAAIRLYKKFG